MKDLIEEDMVLAIAAACIEFGLIGSWMNK